MISISPLLVTTDVVERACSRLLGLAGLLCDPVRLRLVLETTLPVVDLCPHDCLVVHDQHLLAVVAVGRHDNKIRAEVAQDTSEDQVEARCRPLRPWRLPLLTAALRPLSGGKAGRRAR